jgi:hypothetical protein
VPETITQPKGSGSEWLPLVCRAGPLGLTASAFIRMGYFERSAGGSVTARSSRSAAGDAGAATGTYRITGYTLELECANGQVQRLLAFYPFPRKPQTFIANVTFSVE